MSEITATKPKTKRPRKKMVTGLGVCYHCGINFKTKLATTICPNCWKAGKRQQAPKDHVIGSRPQRPNKPKAPIPKMSRAISNLQLSSPVNRLTNRVTKSSASLKAGRKTTTAAARLLLQMLDPAAAVGQRAIRLNIDNITAPKFPIQFDCTFTISTTDNFKILLASSPIVSAVIASPNGNLNIVGADSYTLQGKGGWLTYVIGNKKALITDEPNELLIQNKEDFRKFRMIASSMQIQWSGPELFKNGVFKCARVTDKDMLSDFNPDKKIDSVTANASDVIVLTSQRATATTELLAVDPNNDNPDGGDDLSHEQLTITFGLPGPMDAGAPIIGMGTPTKYKDVMTMLATQANATYAGVTKYKQAFDLWFNTLANKYPHIFDASNNSWRLGWKATCEGDCFSTTGVVLKVLDWTADSANTTFQIGPGADLHAIIFNMLTAASPNVPVGVVTPFPDTTFIGKINLVLELEPSRNINHRIQLPNVLTFDSDENSLIDSLFYDKGFLEPVASYQGSAGVGENAFQVITSHSFEFLLSDYTVLAAEAVANTPKDPEAMVSKPQYDRFQKIMKGMPPALIQSDTGLSRVSTAQLSSRGIIKDIYGMLGPVVSSIFPSTSNIVNTVGGIVDIL